MIRISQCKLRPDHGQEELNRAICQTLHIRPEELLSFEILRASIDARKKPDIYRVYTIDVRVRGEGQVRKRCARNKNVSFVQPVRYHFPYDHALGDGWESDHAPVVVGSGPAGLFCALMLARAGLKPRVIERGADAARRSEMVEQFWQGIRPLDPDTNVQFGEGGAGTFSDGKLNTSIKDPEGRIRFVLETFVQGGADPSILWDAHPHIGTDVLRQVVTNIREQIRQLGGTFFFETRLEDAALDSPSAQEAGRLPIWQVSLSRQTGETREPLVMTTHALVLAIGHSARDTYEMLLGRGLPLRQKAFAVGVRIQHPQKMIDEVMYGTDCPYDLPPAPYKLTYRAGNGRGVYSFCMCPGGYVVNASSEPGRLAVNGMSYHDRGGENANSALVVTVTPEDYDPEGTGDPMAGIAYQRALEEAAYQAGEGQIPVQRLGAFVSGQGAAPGRKDPGAEGADRVQPQFRGGYVHADVRSALPPVLGDTLQEGILAFERQIPGYAREDALLCAVESRTSSPVRIERTQTGEAVGFPGIYPCGEGAGYAGGITSAAVDGLRIAQLLCARLSIDFPGE